MKDFLKKYWPILTLLVLTIVVAITNYKSGTFLTGWDNLHPEFNFGVNIQRSIFAVWQEYQSLGLLGGMGHASDLLHQVFLLILSSVFPLQSLRYVWIFISLFLGGTGAYYLIKKLLRTSLISHLSSLNFISLLGALFYIFNISTIQTYFVPFEVFTFHFAALPWLLLSTLNYFKSPSRKNLIFLGVILLLSTPQGYVPTLFIVYLLSAVIIYLSQFLSLQQSYSRLISTGLKFIATVFIVNAFWLLPFVYFSLTNASVDINAKINQMATDSVVLQNKEFGNLFDVALLRGFWFNNVDPNLNGKYIYMLTPWRDYFTSPVVIGAGLAIFALVIIGLFYSLESKNRDITGFGALFIFAFTMLAISTPPFSWFDILFRQIPLFGEAFRFTFTKFSILTSLSYAVLLSLGFTFIVQIFKKVSSKIQVVIAIIIIALIATTTFPVFQGYLFYQKETINIPSEYFRTFDYFKHQDQNSRIADLPQPTFWGWVNYRWGYGGSGFLWYGIKQPILDRAFDVWSKESENYYYELSSALYSKNPTALENVLNKYQVSFVLLDKNVIYPPSPKSLFYDEIEGLLAKIPGVKLAANYGKIYIYKIALRDNPRSFIFATSKLPEIQIPFWKTTDPAYSTFGSYTSNPNPDNQNQALIYPFGSLFSEKTVNEDFILSKQDDSIALSKDIELNTNSKLIIPGYFTAEENIPFKILAAVGSNGETALTGDLSTPQILLDGKKIWGETVSIPLFVIPNGSSYPISININGGSNFVLNGPVTSSGKVGTGFISSVRDNSIALSSKSFSKTVPISTAIFKSFATNIDIPIVPSGKHKLLITWPKINDSYLSIKPDLTKTVIRNCNEFSKEKQNDTVSLGQVIFDETGTSACTSYSAPTFMHKQGYALFVKSDNLKGRPLHFWVLNEDEKTIPIDTYLDKNHGQYVLQPMEEDGLGYSFHFDNVSVGRTQNQNILSSFEAYPLPYEFITNITIDSRDNPSIGGVAPNVFSVSHPNESLYVATLSNLNNPATLVLSQAYDPGWKAFDIKLKTDNSKLKTFLAEAFPFWFGSELKNHVEVNGWANAWLLDNSHPSPLTSHLIIVFLPQYFEYAGLALLIGLAALLGGIIGIKGIKHRMQGRIFEVRRVNP